METILIVDDEESVRRTTSEWLQTAERPYRVLVDETGIEALRLIETEPIDLAVLDWNLGFGIDGLRLLEMLHQKQPNLVAILMTGYANKVTPLDALRHGVRDYLEKGTGLSRDVFLTAIERQLAKIRPFKREQQITAGLKTFRDAVARVIPLVEAGATLNDPVPLPEAIRSLFRFLRATTQAAAGVLIVRYATGDQHERVLLYDLDGKRLSSSNLPFAQTLAASVLSTQRPLALASVRDEELASLRLQPFEESCSNLLLMPLALGAGVFVVLELFDKPGGFTEADVALLTATQDIATALLRQALTEKHARTMLLDAIAAALTATDAMQAEFHGSSATTSPAEAAIEQVRQSLDADPNAVLSGKITVQVVEHVRELIRRHGLPAAQHLMRVCDSLGQALDSLSAAAEEDEV